MKLREALDEGLFGNIKRKINNAVAQGAVSFMRRTIDTWNADKVIPSADYKKLSAGLDKLDSILSRSDYGESDEAEAEALMKSLSAYMDSKRKK